MRSGARSLRIGAKKNVLLPAAAAIALGALIFGLRFDLAVRYMQGNPDVRDSVILLMLDQARPVIEKDFKMTLAQKIASALTGRRSEKERQSDALKDVRAFGRLGFANHRLRFLNLHPLGARSGFRHNGFDFALGWKGGRTGEVLFAFNVNFLTRKIGRMRVNPACGFFAELKQCIEAKAKEN